jgi:outer membrane protein OmpA-like peptidoglycan-associated protein
MSRMSVLAAAGLLFLAPASTALADIPNLHAVVYDEASGTVVRSTDGECVRTQWLNDSDVCSGPARAQRMISREERTVYFGFNQASLSPEMRQKLDTLARMLKSDDQVTGARIVGYADRIGNPGYNERLSKLRAENVRRYLADRGLINTRVTDVRWFGASEPSTNCPNDLKRPQLIECLQPDRRVEVEIDYAPQVQASNE